MKLQLVDLNTENKNIKSSSPQDDENFLKETLIREEAQKLKSTFLDNMSHELRTPITVILGYAGILFEELEDPDLKEMAEIILKSSNRLTESLNLLLDQSDVDSKRLQAELERTNLRDVLEEIYNIYKPVVEDKGLSLVFESGLSESYSEVDKKMINKVLTNLMNNALKFTTNGEIKIGLQKEEKGNTNYNCIFISDTGIGIPNEKKNMIFEAFRQVSEGMNRVYQGIGLGLSVAKKFVELMNGEIEVESKTNEGSTFYIKFPEA